MNYFKFRKLKKEIAPMLLEGKIGILPTDTLYGMVCSAMREDSVERVYKARKRSPDKASIILINSLKDLNLFNIKINKKERKVLKKVWPGKVSVILECEYDEFEYLHRGTNSLAFRIPAEKWLQKFLKETGPLIAPSANFEGEKPAITKDMAKRYFENSVDFYVDLGRLTSAPSTIIEIGKNGEIVLIREGAVDIAKVLK